MSRRKRVVLVVAASLAASASSGLLWGVFGTTHDVGRVAATKWAWHINVEQWERVHYKDESSTTRGAYNVDSWEESSMSTDSDGNMLPEWETRYSYDVDEWIAWRTFSKAGRDKKPVPPEYELPTLKTKAKKRKQCQVGSVEQTFAVVLDCGGRVRVWDTDQPNWQRWNPGDLCSVNLNGFGTLRLLEPLKAEAE